MRDFDGGSDLVREHFLEEVTLEQDLKPGSHLLEHPGGNSPVGRASEQADVYGPRNSKIL